MNPYVKIGAIAGSMVLVGVLLTVGLRKTSNAPLAAPAATAATATASDSAPPPTATAAEITPSATATAAPWETGPHARTTAPAPAAAIRMPPPSPPTSSNAQLRTAMEQMDRQMTQNEVQAQALLRQLDTAQATGNLPPGMNPEAARSNIRIAIRAQQLGRELVSVSQQPDTPGRQQRMAQISNELITLRESLRYDVNQPIAAKTTP